MQNTAPIDRVIEYHGGFAKTLRAVKISKQTLANLLKGKRPAPETAILLEESTEGAVTRAELRPDLWGEDTAA